MARSDNIPVKQHPAERPSVLQRLHSNDRGNLGILLLLTIWALVSLIALVWNTGEYATRRRHVQGASDAAAHASSLWVSRTTNLTAASNLVIGQNGSAEIVLRSITPTRTVIQDRFTSEGRRARQIRDGGRAGEPEQGFPDCEFFEELIGFGAWSGNGRGDLRQQELTALNADIAHALTRVVPLLPPPQAQQLQQQMNDRLQRNNAALQWLVGTYVGPTGGTGGGIGASIADWITNQVRPRLEDILTTLDAEQQQLDQWVSQTDPALSAMTPEQLRDVRREIFEYQERLSELTPDVITEQRDALAEFYQVDLTTSVPGQRNDLAIPTPVTAPVVPASHIASKDHTDGIRQRYPEAAFRRFGTSSPEIVVDPINVNVGHAVIWHPGYSVNVPPGVTLAGQTFTGRFGVGGGDWGRVPCAPLNRYINERITRDRERLREEPQAIDRLRDELRGRIYPPPARPDIEVLPNVIPDAPVGSRPIPLPPEPIPRIPLPAGLTPDEIIAITELNRRISQFDAGMRTYVRDLRALPRTLDQMHNNLSNLSDNASQRFADSTWLRYIEQNREFVLREMGWDRTFMVLATYELRNIPEWAVEDMRQDVREYVYRVVYQCAISRLRQTIRSRLQQWAMGVLGSQPGGGRGNIGSQAQQFANQHASNIAANVARRAAQIVSQEVADEWVLRPWPFEIAPPEEEVPPTRGITDVDRHKYFTSLTSAVTTDDSAPRPLLPKLFTLNEKPMVSFAQSETFNWMEFNERFGAADAYDRITFYGHGDMAGSPRPWRLATTGGWNWQPRLSLADAAGQAIEDGQHVREMLEKGGVTHGDDVDAINSLTKH